MKKLILVCSLVTLTACVNIDKKPVVKPIIKPVEVEKPVVVTKPIEKPVVKPTLIRYKAEQISAIEANEILNNRGVLWLDVSKKDSHLETGKIENALVDYPYTNPSEFLKNIDSLNKQATYVVYSNGSGGLGRLAGKLMANNGFKDVKYINGGLNEWKKRGFSVVN